MEAGETWETLKTYLNERLEGERAMLNEVCRVCPEDDEMRSSFQDRIRQLEGFVPFVEEMLRRPAVRAVRPVLSMQIIRLIHKEEFAWVCVLEDGQYSLDSVQYLGSGLDYDVRRLFAGKMLEVADRVERLACEFMQPT